MVGAERPEPLDEGVPGMQTHHVPYGACHPGVVAVTPGCIGLLAFRVPIGHNPVGRSLIRPMIPGHAAVAIGDGRVMGPVGRTVNKQLAFGDLPCSLPLATELGAPTHQVPWPHHPFESGLCVTRQHQHPGTVGASRWWLAWTLALMSSWFRRAVQGDLVGPR